jgi:hypothetical protein
MGIPIPETLKHKIRSLEFLFIGGFDGISEKECGKKTLVSVSRVRL